MAVVHVMPITTRTLFLTRTALTKPIHSVVGSPCMPEGEDAHSSYDPAQDKSRLVPFTVWS